MPTLFIVIVDDDVNPSNLSEVLFAVGTRCNPEDSIDILSGFRCSPSETLVSPEKKRMGDISLGKCVIYACKPYSWINDFPRSQKRRVKLMEEAAKKWGPHLFGQ
jgi:4-hydroxy-3-polyprenylbenzoate decarboxylase